MSSHLRRSRALAGGLALSGALLVAASPASAADPDHSFPLAANFNASTNHGFLASPGDSVIAPSQTRGYVAGDFGALSWCTPWAGTHIVQATVEAYRYHRATTARVEVGPAADGSGGFSVPEDDVPQGSAGRQFALDGMNAQCVGARARQTGTQTVLPNRAWTFLLQGMTLVDDQGPSVSAPKVTGPSQAGWYTGPVTVSWTSADNDWFRGSTGASVGGGHPTELGDLPNGGESATLTPAADGPQTVEVHRAGQGWPTASASVDINVDQTPPSRPVLQTHPADPSGSTSVSADGSADTASGLAGYQYAWVDSHARLGFAVAGPTFSAPETYLVVARALDKAGNIGAWSAPVAVVVGGDAALPAPDTSPEPDGAITAASDAPLLPDFSGVRLDRLQIPSSTLELVAGDPVPRLEAEWGSPVTVRGRFSHRNDHGLRGALVELRAPDGQSLATTQTGSSGGFSFTLAPPEGGIYTVAAIGTPEVTGTFEVVLRPRLTLALGRRRGSRAGAPVPAGRDGTLVVSGHLTPEAQAAGKRVRLDYRSRLGKWLPAQDVLADTAGTFTFRYRFGVQATPVLGRMRVVVPEDAGWPFAAALSAPFRVLVG